MNKMSKGEQKVAQLLSYAGVRYAREYSFKDLKGGKEQLRFDFAIFKNGQLWCCLEVDGRQHFQYTPFFHKSQIDFRRQKEYDMRKNKYCLSHRIPLIRIPYWALDDLTFDKIFTTQEFIVRTPNHNINLIGKEVR